MEAIVMTSGTANRAQVIDGEDEEDGVDSGTWTPTEGNFFPAVTNR